EVAAQRVGRRVGDGVDEPVEATPALFQRLGQRVDLLLVVHIHLKDLWRRFQPSGALLGQAHDPAETRQHDIGALPLSQLGDRKGDTGRGQYPGDQDLLPLEDHRAISSWRRFLNSSLSISPRAKRCSRVTRALSWRTF